MHQVSYGIKGQALQHHDWVADVPKLVQPKLKEHVTIKGGQMYYNGLNNEQYRADLFDRYFKVKRLKEE